MLINCVPWGVEAGPKLLHISLPTEELTVYSNVSPGRRGEKQKLARHLHETHHVVYIGTSDPSI